MPTNRWTRVDAIFAGALTLSLEERDEYVRRACAGDDAVRREVEGLLRAAVSADEFFERLTPPPRLDPEAIAPAPILESGTEIGAYRLVRLLGEGGMGAVYLAERADGQFEQRVAIKIVRPSRVRGGELIQRFLRERQILARLQHPSIARLYDGGVTADGQPFLAMEYVDGEPITEWCDARELPVRGRLELFQHVGRAVQYAHRNLIIHRDLKPSNILVTPEGEVRLLDFGIAKLLEEDEDAAVTRTGGSLMTPAYAAPEQIGNGAVTTATDVYALGVLLYQLLTGRRPHGAAGAPPHEVARAVLEEPPIAPSAALERPTVAETDEEPPSAAAVARARGTGPERLRRLLSGDVDRICMMALRKEPDRRYGSAQALVDDLDRHLRGHPVAARPDTLGYRSRKFVSRHRTGVVAAGLILVTLIGGLGAALWQAGIASREATKTREVSDFVLGLFEVSDPDETLAAGDITVRDLLRRGAERIETELVGQPEVQAEMYSVVGPIFRRLGLYDDARPLLARAVELERSRAGRESAAHAEAVYELGRVEREAGNLEVADSLLVDALRWAEASAGANSLLAGRVLVDRAGIAEIRNRHADADSMYREARARLVRSGAPASEVLLLDLDHAEVLHMLGEADAAGSLYESIIERREALPPERTLALAKARMELGIQASYGGDLDRAEPLFREALDLRREALGDQHREVALAMSELARVVWARGRRDEAVELNREAVDMLRETIGPDHPDYAMRLGTLAVMVNWHGRVEEAAGMFREVERIQAEVLGEEHFHLAMTRRNLGRSLLQLDRPAEALPKFEAALAGWIRAQGDQEFFTGPTRLDIARTLAELGNRARADSVIDLLLSRYRESPPQDGGLGDVLLLRARLHAREGDWEPAVSSASAALEEYEARGLTLARGAPAASSGALQRASAEAALGEYLLELGRLEEAESHLLPAYRALAEARGPSNVDASNARGLLERLYREQGRPDEAARLGAEGG